MMKIMNTKKNLYVILLTCAFAIGLFILICIFIISSKEQKKPHVIEKSTTIKVKDEPLSEDSEALQTPLSKKYEDEIIKYDYANECVYKFIRLINEKNYKEAYKLLESEFKKTVDIDTLKKDFDFDEQIMFNAYYFNVKEDGQMELSVKIFNDLPSEMQMVENQTIDLRKTFIIIPEDEKDYALKYSR